MEKVIVAAVASNGVIGSGGSMPWKCPMEMAHFRGLTLGGKVVMGRNTYESLGHSEGLPGRTNIVVSASMPRPHETVWIFPTLRGVYDFFSDYDGPLFLIGGARLYSDALLLDDGYGVDRMIISHMKFPAVGDTYFPAIDEGVWEGTVVSSFPEFDVKEYRRRD